MDQDATGREVGLGSDHFVFDRDAAPLPQRGTAPSFRRLSIVAKLWPISATAEHLQYSIEFYYSVLIRLEVGRSQYNRRIRREAQLSQRDRAALCVSWNLVDCCTTVSENALLKARTR